MWSVKINNKKHDTTNNYYILYTRHDVFTIIGHTENSSLSNKSINT